MAIDRDAAIVELADPATEAARLAEIAYAHPDLAEPIIAHPNAYPGLVEWLASYRPAAAAPVAVAVAVAPSGPTLSAPTAASPVPARARKQWSRRELIGGGAGILAFVLIVGGAFVITLVGNLRAASDAAQYYDYSYTDEGDTSGDGIGCPDGASMLMWAEWSGGATVVCDFGGGSYVMLVGSGGTVAQSTSVSATPTGFASELGELAVGGWLFWLPGVDEAYPAQSWGNINWGELSSDQSYQIPACPSGSYAVSLSTWSGGWLLACGSTNAATTAFSYQDGSRTGSGGTLEYVDGRYCGTDNDGSQVCVSSSPALVQIGSDRYSADANFFSGDGPGGAGQGTGAYGIDSPGETAADQVGYLVAILQKSAEARSTVNAALAPLNYCAVSSSDRASLENLTKARTDLLAALRTTPVDQVANGDKLLSLLTQALELSARTDQGYVDAARLMEAGDCAGGNKLYGPALALGDQAEAAKVAFVTAWNASIPATYGVRSYSAGDI